MITLEEAVEELRKEMELYKQMFDKHVEHLDSLMLDIIYMIKDDEDGIDKKER